MSNSTKFKWLTVGAILCVAIMVSGAIHIVEEKARVAVFIACIGVENMEYVRGNCRAVRDSND